MRRLLPLRREGRAPRGELRREGRAPGGLPRRERRGFAGLVGLVAGALLLAGCVTSPATDGGPLPAVSGQLGEFPTLTFPDAEPSGELEVAVLEEGDGETVESGDLLLVDYVGQLWDGDVFDTSFESPTPASFAIGVGRVIQGWDFALVGRQVGSRVVMSVPPYLGYGTDGNPAAGIGGEDTLVFVVDIYGTFAPDSAGSPDAQPTAEAGGIGPRIEGELGSAATIAVPAGVAEPQAQVGTVLARADGEPAVEGSLVVQYAATYWDNSLTESTWEMREPEVVPVGLGSPFDELLGVPVGSRVLIEAPGNETVPAVALVVDIVAQANATG